jgi:hypothetical protein
MGALEGGVIGSSWVDVGVLMTAQALKGLHNVSAKPGSVIA